MFRVQNRLRAFLNPFLSEYRQKNGAAAHSFVQQPRFYCLRSIYLQRLAELLQVGAELLADLRML